MADETVLWRRLDRPGHEAVRLSRNGSKHRLAGTAVFAHDGRPCVLEYLVLCAPDWRTVSAQVAGWLGDRAVEVEVAADEGQWRLDGVACPEVAGCLDLDLNFSPATNLLPIRRLELAVATEAPVAAAWLRFPSFTLERLDELYRRTGEATYRYESGGGSFVADLRVNATGFVVEYPGFWQADMMT